MTLEVQAVRTQVLGDLPRRSAHRFGVKTALIVDHSEAVAAAS